MHCDDSPDDAPVRELWHRIRLSPRPRRDGGPAVAVTPEVSALITAGAAVAVGVSGGKDSDACAIAVARHLDQVGHTGPRLLVHSDLGRVEWRQSMAKCEEVARHLGMELAVVRRKAGDMLARWQGRWANNVQRYAELECVRLILPWSTPSMRFCTSELKTDLISSALKKRFPEHPIVNATGIRRQESASRAKMPVAAPMAKLQRRGLAGMAWNPIIEFSIEEVLSTIASEGLDLHEAYTCYGCSRVSCAYCIMSTHHDLKAASTCEDNQALYQQMVELEVASTFAFQGARWLGDVAPHLLPAQMLREVERAKARAMRRQVLEAAIPSHLLFKAGKPWPQAIPTPDEAELLASIRREVQALIGVEGRFVDGPSVRQRYQELHAAHAPEPELAFALEDDEDEQADRPHC